ncbi:hypothetical protein ACEPPZ_14515 [Paracoccus yeei]|uniref:hypothetical protein n=1 Tax=Paracoccus yeei TaxID=147645 RepID=UPI0028D3198B|nr:hypothetical protein [Paracoccus yeei]
MMWILDTWRGSPERKTVPAPGALPAELVATIQAARVRRSPRPDAEGNEIVKVRAVTLGEFRWQGIEDAAERIERIWPELTPALCVRAAQLLEAIVGNAAMDDLKRKGERRPWVWDF